MSQTFTLADIAKQFAQIDSRFTHFHAKIYSIVTPELEKFQNFLHELRLSAASAPNRHPFNIVVGDFSSVISLQSTMVPSVKDGTLVMNAHVSNAKLPSCSYLCIISPAIGDGNSINYSEAFAAINFARAFLCLILEV